MISIISPTKTGFYPADMTPSDALNGIQEVAENHLDFQGNLREETPLTEALRLDSIRLMTLIVELENHFQLCLEDGDEVGLETVGQLVDLLQKRSQ